MRLYHKKYDSNERIVYCPTCGDLTSISPEDIKHLGVCDNFKYHKCKTPWRGELRHRSRYILTEYKLGDDFPDDELEPPSTFHGFTLPMYELIWEKYLYSPDNICFNQASHEAFKEWITDFLNKGGYGGKLKRDRELASSTPTCPRCGSKSISTQKQGFGAGKAAAGAVAGAVIAGPVGLAGAAAGAVGANKVYNVCQKCGHKWEPGK